MSTDAARGRAYAGKNRIARATTELASLVQNPDLNAVFISNINEMYRDQLFAVAAVGMHVLCDEPLALNLADARAMIAECAKRGVLMGTNHHLLNAATYRAMRGAIAGGIGAAIRPCVPASVSAGASARPASSIRSGRRCQPQHHQAGRGRSARAVGRRARLCQRLASHAADGVRSLAIALATPETARVGLEIFIENNG
jgi:hypothetical protein